MTVGKPRESRGDDPRHLLRIAAVSGRTISRDEAVAVLSHNRGACDLWKQRMHAGEE